MTETTTISIRVSKEKKQEFDEVCEDVGISRQKALEGFVDRVIEKRPILSNQVKSVKQQVMEIAIQDEVKGNKTEDEV